MLVVVVLFVNDDGRGAVMMILEYSWHVHSFSSDLLFLEGALLRKAQSEQSEGEE